MYLKQSLFSIFCNFKKLYITVVGGVLLPEYYIDMHDHLYQESSHREGVEGKCRKDKGIQAWTSSRVQANTPVLLVIQELATTASTAMAVNWERATMTDTET